MSTTADEKEYTQRALTLRNEGRLDEAVVAGRKATGLAPTSANAWWQLALALSAKNSLAQAIDAFERVTVLAPRFAEGWCELGHAHKRVARLDKAIANYEAALVADAEHVRSLKLLDVALKEREGKDDARRRIGVLQTLNRLGALEPRSNFELGFLLAEQQDYIGAAFAYEAYTKDFGGWAAHYNLGLAYQNLGRDVDAINEFRFAAGLNEVDPKPQQSIDRILPRLRTLRQKVLDNPEKRLKQDDWYKHYVNPFALLKATQVEELRQNPKAFQKAKQALLREIDLEDGKIAWLPGLVIDRSKALTILDALNDETQWLAHQFVHENPHLEAFLACGRLSHFLVTDALTIDISMANLGEEPVLEIISPAFARQYDLVLTRAIDLGDVDAVECMFDGRRWVLPQHEEDCLEGPRRAVERLCEPLRKLVGESEKRNVNLGEVESTFKNGKLDQILAHLPAEFYAVHMAVYGFLSDLAVNYLKKDANPEAAKAIIGLGKVSAARVPSLSHQLAEDEKVIDGLIAKEKATEAHLTVNKLNLDITRTGVSYGNLAILVPDIVAVRWGAVRTSNVPPTARFRLAFKDFRGTDIDVCWTAQYIGQQEKLWHGLLDATMHHLMNSVVANFKARLASGTPTRVGPLEVKEEGVVFEVPGWFSKKKVLCCWKNLVTSIKNGEVLLKDATNGMASAALDLDSIDNAIVLHMLASNQGN
ncbi:tetratricopeptide repeat protein [Paraburkholderia sp. BR10954]|uniref:tetratricopeptide repeat protein n=1 Tax=Paraburkholderia sp. BR10954 TaxID=3236995 RepID=UPI0034D2E4AB